MLDHVSIGVQDVAASRTFYDAAVKPPDKPGVRADYSATYYAAFVIDPDRYRLEAHCEQRKVRQ